MRFLLGFAAVTALALSAPILAKPDGKPDRGGGNPHAGGKAQGGGNGHGGGKSHGAGQGRGHGGGKQARGNPHFGGGGPAIVREDRGKDRGGVDRKRERVHAAAQRGGRDRVERSQRRAEFRQLREQKRESRELLRPEIRDGREARLQGFERDFASQDPRAGRDCPPGLARKNNGCLPPGQAKKVLAIGEAFPAAWTGNYNLPSGYRDLYYDNQDYAYRYDDSGYIYRIDRQSDMVSGLMPLLGGGFGVGQLLPAGYDAYNVPFQYRDLYADTPDASYRYGDDAIYQVDPQSGMIESIVALLTGSNPGIGQALPSGFDAYNLPLQYRDEYQDGDDAIYRYADGNIYQADPKTQIIEQIISALG